VSRHVTTTELVLVAVAAFGWMVGKIAEGVNRIRRRNFPRLEDRQQMLALPPTPASAVSEGLVRVTGRVRARDQRLAAPISGRSCVAYEIRIGMVQRSGPYQEVVVRRDARPFLVEDDRSAVMIEPADCFRLALERDVRGGYPWHRITSLRQWAAVTALIGNLPNLSATEIGPFDAVRYWEGVLEEGEQVAVHGRADRELDPDAQPMHPRDLPYRTLIRGTLDSFVTISDDPSALA
jgi:hypothetical protein